MRGHVVAREMPSRGERDGAAPAGRPGDLEDDPVGSAQRGRTGTRQPVVEPDPELVDERQEDRIAGGDGPAGVHRTGTHLGVVTEPHRLGVRNLVGGRPLDGARERQQRDPKEHDCHRADDAGRADAYVAADGLRGARILSHDSRRSVRTGAAGTAFAPIPASALRLGGAQQRQADHADQDCGGDRRVKRGEKDPPMGKMEPELADQVRPRRLHRIQEVVVVALERVAAVVDGVDAVQHDDVQQRAVIRDDVPHLVLGRGLDEGQVAGLEPRLHADAVGDDVAGGSADQRRSEEVPARQSQRQQGTGEDGGADSVSFHDDASSAGPEDRLEERGWRPAALFQTVSRMASCW
jgi:hypothetical protein